MNLKGERTIPASVEKTWVALNDPQTLKACIAGCESIEATAENQYLAVMAVRIGPVNAKFKGKLQLSDIVALESYKINFEGQGGVAGFGKGSAAVTLSPVGTDGKATNLNYVADAQVGGKIAQIGSRLVESAAAKIADDFFKAFEAKMTEPISPSAVGVAASSETGDASSGAGPGVASGAGSGLTSGFGTDNGSSFGGSGTAASGASSTASGAFDAPSATRSAASSPTPYSAPMAAAPAMDTGIAGTRGADQGANPGANPGPSPGAGPAGVPAAAAAAAGTMSMRPAATLDHVLERESQPLPTTGRGSTVWWIAGIIILAVLVYFFTR